jgi:hypothetical protein
MEKFESVEIFRNIHKGQPAFVLGAAPSLKECDISKLYSNGIIISCNSSIVELNYADYFIFADEAVVYFNFYEKVSNISKNVIFAGRGIDYKFFHNDINGYNEKIEFKGKKYLIDRRYDNFGRPFINNNTKGAADFNLRDGKIVDGSDVCHGAANFAYILGCDPIYMIGVDLQWDKDERYFRSFDDDSIMQRSNSPRKYMDNKSYFKPNNVDTALETSYNCWKKICNENSKLNIKCTSEKSRLKELFEYVDINNIKF